MKTDDLLGKQYEQICMKVGALSHQLRRTQKELEGLYQQLDKLMVVTPFAKEIEKAIEDEKTEKDKNAEKPAKKSS